MRNDETQQSFPGGFWRIFKEGNSENEKTRTIINTKSVVSMILIKIRIIAAPLERFASGYDGHGGAHYDGQEEEDDNHHHHNTQT